MSLWSYFQGAGAGEAPSGAETVEKLCHRLESSTLIDDRRDALRAIKSLSRKFKLEVGTQAMVLLCQVLERDRDDPELAGFALDTIVHIVSCDPEEENPQPELSAQFAEIFSKDAHNIHLVLECVDEQDSQLRVPALKVLTALLESHTRTVQEHILTFPQGCSRLIDVLTDHREYIRNYAILLLIHLTSSNANIQKIIVFDDAFPRLIDIIVAEGSADGGVIVEDCLRILLNLLRNNPSNQTLFRENSHIAQLPQFFCDASSHDFLQEQQQQASAADAEAEGWSTQRVTNVLQMLSLVRVLVSPANPTQNTRHAQRNVLQCGLLKSLANILMASGVPAEVLTETVNCVAECIRGFDQGQRFLSEVQAPANPPRPAIVVLLMSMVNERQPLPLRLSVLYAFQCYLYRNPDGQAAVVSTLLPSSAEVQEVTAGQLLCAGLFSSDAQTAWLASVALFYAVHANAAQKEQLLRVQLATGLGSPPVSLLQHCANLLSRNPGVKAKLGLLQLMSGWLTQAPLVAKALLGNPANVNLAISELHSSDHSCEDESLVKGLYAYLLGVCILAGHRDLLALVERRIGAEQFLECIERVSKSEIYVKSLKSPQPSAQPSLDHEFSKLFKTIESEIVRSLNCDADAAAAGGGAAANAGSRGQANAQQFAEHESVVGQYKQLINEQDAKLRAALAQAEQLTRERATMQEQIRGLRDQNIVLKAARGLQAPAAAATSSSVPSALNELGNEDQQQQQLQQLQQELATKEQEVNSLRNELETVRAAVTTPAADASGNPYFADDYEAVKLQNSQLFTRIHELEQQLAGIDELQTVKDRLQARIDELLVIEAERDQLRSTCQQLQQQQQPNGEELQQLQQQLADASAKSAEIQADRDALKAENEDLLVLLSDQDSKIESLKSQVKELGGEVPEEEEEDEDIDDEEQYEDN